MRRELHYRVSLAVEAECAYAWHEHISAFNRLSPAWESTRMLSSEGIREGGRAVIAIPSPLGPLHWHAEHFDIQKGREFSDRQLKGPFRFWVHRHLFERAAPGTCTLHDIIRYELPLSPISDLFAGWFVRRKLAAMFAYRHRVVSNDLAFWNLLPEKKVKRILLTGSSGLVGSALAQFLQQGGYEVIGVSRRSGAGIPTVIWDLNNQNPSDASLLLDGQPLDAVVHLAGESIADGRWSEARKQQLVRSRVDATHNLISGLQKLGLAPRVFVSASGVGLYGDRGSEILTEESAPGGGFLGELAQAWEAAARASETAFSARSVQLRMGAVLTPRGGALAKMLLPFKCGVGGVLGTGQQWMSWVALDDVLYAITYALETQSLSGAVNLVSPHPVTNAEFTRVLAQVLKRPAVLPVPAFALRLGLGALADELLLNSQRAVPKALLASGFEFRHADLSSALSFMLGKNRI